jgi:hypothetical protein
MNICSFLASEDEMHKIAGALNRAIKSPAAIGAAIGGVSSAIHNARGELKKRNLEDYLVDKSLVQENRKKRLKRLVADTALSAGGGALIGHVGAKGIKALQGKATDTAKAMGKTMGDAQGEGIKNHIEDVNIRKVLNPFKRKPKT